MNQVILQFFYCFTVLFFSGRFAAAQTLRYTTANGHAHNDYEHNIPFVQAYQLGFGSIEADVILEKDTLYVGHQHSDLYTRPLYFERDYVLPLSRALQQQKDSSRTVILLIDLKTEAVTTLNKVISIIERYSQLTVSSSVQFVITGNQPAPSAFEQYPSFIFFDGNINNPEHLRYPDRIALFSDNFKNYSDWKGKGRIRPGEKQALNAVIEKAHAFHKRIRFWGCPDNAHTWSTFMKMQIDYINTDQVEKFARFISSQDTVLHTDQ